MNKFYYVVSYLAVFAGGILAGSLLRRCTALMLAEEGGGFYPAAELLNGLLYVLIFRETGWRAEGVLFCASASALLAAGIVDQRTFEIPIACNILIGILGCIHVCFDPCHWQQYLAGMSAVSSFLLILHLLTGGRGIGGGDIKLMVAAGLLLGWEKILLALFIGAVSGAAIHILLMKLKNKGRILAFGPYLAFGIFIAMVYGDKCLSIGG